MAKKGMVEREKKRQNLVYKYNSIRESLRSQIKFNSMKVRLRNRCFVTGKPRGFYRDFGLSRNMLRYMGHECLIPGLVKSSW